MDDKKSISILLKLLEKNTLTKDEKEAIKKAIGILGWTMYAEKKLEKLEKRKKK
ncbi:MAG: hypothetical protein PHX25_03395 [Candidatus Pacebacteria bacterium]|nr:hypothetical protein [Candidatus Paceibacterota bacterium]